MTKMYIFKVSQATVGKHFLSEVKKIQYDYWTSSHPVTTTMKSILGYKVLCVDIEVGNLTTNDLSAHKLRFGADSPDCLLVGVMDSPRPNIDRVSAQITNYLSTSGEFAKPLTKRRLIPTVTNNFPTPQAITNPTGFVPRLLDLN